MTVINPSVKIDIYKKEEDADRDAAMKIYPNLKNT
jgi:hypothetical protein